MYINDVDISTYGARLLGIKNNSTNITNNYFIPPNNNTPVFVSSTNCGKQISVRIAINGNTADGNYQVYSKLKKDMNKCVLKPKNSIFYFDCILIGDNVNTQFRKVIKEVEFTFICYQYTDQQSKSLSTLANTVTNSGTAITPPVIKIVTTSAISLTISINGTSYLLSSLSSGKTYILNSETCKFTEDGTNCMNKLSATNMPMLESGDNTILLSTLTGHSTTITWKPRWI